MNIRNVGTALSLALSVAIFNGCDSKQPEKAGTAAAKPAAAEAKHAAHGTGPHEGAVADWGAGKYHVEFTVDHEKKQATVYVLGSDEKTAAPIKAKDGKILLSINQPAFQVELTASPEAGETSGASRYVGTNDKLGIVQEFAGSISGEVDGTPYVGEFKEEPHK